jgi:hypothetical protein
VVIIILGLTLFIRGLTKDEELLELSLYGEVHLDIGSIASPLVAADTVTSLFLQPKSKIVYYQKLSTTTIDI